MNDLQTAADNAMLQIALWGFALGLAVGFIGGMVAMWVAP